jgi:hypothetical protein
LSSRWETGAGGDECSLIVVAKVPPEAADDERLHGGAGPHLHRGADSQAQAASDVGIVVEGDLVAAEVEAVDIGPVDGDGGERLDEGAMAERAEAVARVGPDTDGGGIERVGKAQGSRLELHEMHVKQGVYEQPASEIGGIAAHLPAVEAEQGLMAS